MFHGTILQLNKKGLLSKKPYLVTLFKGRITEAATTMPLLRLSSLLST